MAMVCLCHGVSERTIRRAVERGATSVAEVGDQSRAGTCCMSCHPTIEAVLEREAVVAPPRRRFALA
jgi:assimilatory nitrate reductase catalytic subunit